MEFNMQSEINRESEMEDVKRKLRVRMLRTNLTVLKQLGQKLKGVQKVIFRGKYGNMLGLLRLDA